MKLHCGSLLYALRHQPIIVTDQFGMPSVLPVSDKTRRSLMGTLASQIHNSAKYIFDSGSDQDLETVQAVRDTAVNMMEFNLFHMPHPVMWIEDPFDDDDSGETARNYYLAREHKDRIDILFFQEVKAGMLGSVARFILYPFPLSIDLTAPCDEFRADINPNAMPAFLRGPSEAVYSFKKLIVTLYTRGTLTETVALPTGRQSSGTRNRSYPHQIVRIPLHEPARDPSAPRRDSTQSASPRPRRAKLVRGYVWGFKTRPLEEQRWISAYWRNLEGGAPPQETHYQVG